MQTLPKAYKRLFCEVGILDLETIGSKILCHRISLGDRHNNNLLIKESSNYCQVFTQKTNFKSKVFSIKGKILHRHQFVTLELRAPNQFVDCLLLGHISVPDFPAQPIIIITKTTTSAAHDSHQPKSTSVSTSIHTRGNRIIFWEQQQQYTVFTVVMFTHIIGPCKLC